MSLVYKFLIFLLINKNIHSLFFVGYLVIQENNSKKLIYKKCSFQNFQKINQIFVLVLKLLKLKPNMSKKLKLNWE